MIELVLLNELGLEVILLLYFNLVDKPHFFCLFSFFLIKVIVT